MNGTVILDGGMGKELFRMGAPFRQPEWSALALMEEPEAVLTAHRNFIDAGAEIVTTNAYAVVPFHLGDERFAERGRDLARLAAELGRRAADEAEHDVRVAGCLPPALGSYQSGAFDAAKAGFVFDTLIEAQAPFVDLWLAETMGSRAEAAAVVEALDRHGSDRPRWISYALADFGSQADPNRPRLWSQESVTEAVAEAVRGRAEAVLINCAKPEVLTAAVPELAAAVADHAAAVPGLVWGAYANTFEDRSDDGYSANNSILGHRADMTVDVYADVTRGWVEAGATIVGGCCGIHPEHIKAMAANLRQAPLRAGPNRPRPGFEPG